MKHTSLRKELTGAMRRAERSLVTAMQAQPNSVRTDLGVLAQNRRIRELAFVDMLPEGGLAPVAGGFELYVRDATERSIAPFDSEAGVEMSVRQRFTVAHEIAHTFFFDCESDPPRELASTPEEDALEGACDELANQILVRPQVLRERLRGVDRVSAKLTLALADEFCVSSDVILRSLDRIGCGDCDSLVMLIDESRGRDEATIRAFYYGAGLLAVRPRPKLFGKVATWWGEDGPVPAGMAGDQQWVGNEGRETLSFCKTQLPGNRHAFLLQISRSPMRTVEGGDAVGTNDGHEGSRPR